MCEYLKLPISCCIIVSKLPVSMVYNGMNLRIHFYNTLGQIIVRTLSYVELLLSNLSALSDYVLSLLIVVPGVVVDGCCNRTYFSYALQELIMGYFRPRLSNITEEQCYHALDFNYTPWPHIHNTDSNRNMLVKVGFHQCSRSVCWRRFHYY